MTLDLHAIRGQFPLIRSESALAYLDSAATSQKPDVVLDAMRAFYETSVGSVHRSMHILSERATDAYEYARATVHEFLNARYDDEIIFTKNATEAINLVAYSWARKHLRKGDAVLLSPLEHHSNIIPWMQLRQQLGIRLEWLSVDENGSLDIIAVRRALKQRDLKLWPMTGLSNVLGNRMPLQMLLQAAHQEGVTTLVDGSQLVAHQQVDVQALRCDFLAFSGHKLHGPDGIGVLYGRRELLEDMSPFLGGGSMIREVRPTGFTPADPPQRFEAGTQPVSGAVGLGAAIEWLSQFPWEDRHAHEQSLLKLLDETLRSVEGVTVLGPARVEDRMGLISFVMEGIHAHDVAEVLGKHDICVRAGNHCAQPLHEAFGIPASVRVSLAIHTTEEEIRRIGPALEEAKHLLSA